MQGELPGATAAGVRFLAAVQEGAWSHTVGGPPVSERRLDTGGCEAFVALRENGCRAEDTQAELGYFSALALVWNQQRLTAPSGRRHHLAVDHATEAEFWRSFPGGDTLDAARRSVGISRATAYRRWQ